MPGEELGQAPLSAIDMSLAVQTSVSMIRLGAEPRWAVSKARAIGPQTCAESAKHVLLSKSLVPGRWSECLLDVGEMLAQYLVKAVEGAGIETLQTVERTTFIERPHRTIGETI